jgi:hypothetical protein
VAAQHEAPPGVSGRRFEARSGAAAARHFNLDVRDRAEHREPDEQAIPAHATKLARGDSHRRTDLLVTV